MDWASSTNFRRPLLPNFTLCRSPSPLAVGWPTFVAYAYDNDSAYDNFHGVDLTPWNNGQVPGYSNLVGPTHSFPKLHSGLTYQFCEQQDSSGGNWHVQRVGPFSTKGNNAWWQMGGRDALNLSGVIAREQKIFITEQFLGPIYRDGRFVPMPLLHVHHVHVMRSFADIPRSTPLAPMYMYVRTGENPAILEHHSESMYNDEDGTLHSEADAAGFGRLLDTGLEVTVEINDYRPEGAAELIFYLQLACKWHAATSAKLIPVTFQPLDSGSDYGSNYGLNGVAAPPYAGHQLALGGFRWCDEPAVMYNHGIFGRSGKIIALKHHNHMSFTESSFLFFAPLSKFPLLNSSLGDVHLAERIAFLRDEYPIAPTLRRARALEERKTILLSRLGQSFAEVEKELMYTGKADLRCKLTPKPRQVDGITVDTFGEQACSPFPWFVHRGQETTTVTFVKPAKRGVPFAIHSSWGFMTFLETPPRTCAFHVCVFMPENQIVGNLPLASDASVSPHNTLGWTSRFTVSCSHVVESVAAAALILQLAFLVRQRATLL